LSEIHNQVEEEEKNITGPNNHNAYWKSLTSSLTCEERASRRIYLFTEDKYMNNRAWLRVRSYRSVQ